MKNMKIAMKLILSFVLVAALAAAVGIVGIVGMTSMDKASTKMYEEQAEPIPYLSKVISTLQDIRINTCEYAIGAFRDDFSQIYDAYTAIENYKKVMTENLDAYQATISDDNEESLRLFNEARELYDTSYLESLRKCWNYAKASDAAGIMSELGNSQQLAATIVNNLDRCMEIKTGESKTASDNISGLAQKLLIIIIVVLALAMGAALILAMYISGLISRPVIFMKDILLKIGVQGDLNFSEEEYQQIDAYAKVKDEVGESLDMLNTMVHRLVDVGEKLGTVASGDLTAKITLLSEGDTMGLSLYKMLDNLNYMFSEINSATSQVTAGSKQIADGAQNLAEGSTEQSSAVEQLSTSIAEIAAKTKENADMALHAANLADRIKSNAEKGNMQMDSMMASVKEINNASKNISKVIGVIDNIAFQTNILALNAAVEAARAGQHGKGFAVVAEEVRSLASKSAQAAKETGALIANSMEKAAMGANIADETAASLEEIVSGINESSRIVNEIAKSSDAQAEAIKIINRGIDQVAQVAQQNSATAQQSAAASEQMSGQASVLEGLIAQFKLKDMPAQLDTDFGNARREIEEEPLYNVNIESETGKY